MKDKKVFTRKNGSQKGGGLYTWSPDRTTKKHKDYQGPQNLQNTNGSKDSTNSKYFCISALGTQGNDFKTKYSYVIVINTKGIAERSAYVVCDYAM